MASKGLLKVVSDRSAARFQSNLVVIDQKVFYTEGCNQYRIETYRIGENQYPYVCIIKFWKSRFSEEEDWKPSNTKISLPLPAWIEFEKFFPSFKKLVENSFEEIANESGEFEKLLGWFYNAISFSFTLNNL